MQKRRVGDICRRREGEEGSVRRGGEGRDDIWVFHAEAEERGGVIIWVFHAEGEVTKWYCSQRK